MSENVWHLKSIYSCETKFSIIALSYQELITREDTKLLYRCLNYLSHAVYFLS